MDINATDTDITCPSCGRFTGTYTTCPSCGAPVEKRMRILVFRWGAGGVAVLGLLLLYLAAVYSDIEPIKANEVTETMNFAFVRVTGTGCCLW